MKERTMRQARSLALVGCLGLAALGCARGPDIKSPLPLKRVVVYRNGVGYFERAGRVEAESVVFKMRERMVGDFLASMAIMQRGGSSVRSASFPIEVEEESKRPIEDRQFHRLIDAWKPPRGPERTDPADMREVTLRLGAGEHDLIIGYLAETPVWKPSYRIVVQPDGQVTLQAWGIVQNLSGEDWEGVSLALVAGAPIAFRSTLADPVIPVRPVVTDKGEVISRVPEGVTSLREQDAKASAAPPAPEAVRDDAPQAAPGQPPTAKPAPSKTRRKEGERASSGATMPVAQPEPKPKPALDRDESLSAPRDMSALAALAVEAGTTRYEIPGKLSLPDQSATMVLLLNRNVPGAAVYLFAPDGGVPDSSKHPFRVVRFTNATQGLLEGGPIAVYEKGAFLGQGLLSPLPSKAKAVVPFALERSLAVESDRRYEQQGARLAKIEAQRLVIERDEVIKTEYSLKNGGAEPSQVLIRHPRQHGTRLYEPPPGTEDNLGEGNALVPVAVKPHSRAKVVVDERRARDQQVDWLSPLADEAVRHYLKHEKANQKAVQDLRNAWEIREKLRKARDEHQKQQREQQELEKATRELRLSLKAIEKNPQAGDLRRKLTKMLDQQLSRLDKLTKELIELEMQESELQVRFREAIRDLRIVERPSRK